MVSSKQPPVLVAETADVRPFARLLRGVGFKTNAVVNVSDAGLTVQVDEARTLSAISYVSCRLFDKYEFNPPSKKRRSADADDDDVFGSAAAANPTTPSRSTQQSGRMMTSGAPHDDEEEDDEGPPMKEFEVNLNHLLECLNIYGNAMPVAMPNEGRFPDRNRKKWAGEGGDDDEMGSFGGGAASKDVRNTGLIMTWQGDGYPLTLVLKDDDPRSPSTVCKLDLLDPEESNDAVFDEQYKVFHIIMKSNWLREAILDLDARCDRITIQAGPPRRDKDPTIHHGQGKGKKLTEREKAGIFRLEAEGDFGRTVLDFPNDRDIMDLFMCSEPMTCSYSFANFALASRAIQQSIKISLRIDDQGFCSLQMMMPAPTTAGLPAPPGQAQRPTVEDSGIVEYKFCAREDDELGNDVVADRLLDDSDEGDA